MNVFGCRNVHAKPDSRTAASASMWYAATALLMSPRGTALLDCRTTCSTPASRAWAAPPTLYRLFGSKDHLVVEYLERADRLYRQWFTEAVERGGADPGARI